MMTITVTGQKEIARKFELLDRRARRQVLRKGARAGGTIITRALKARVPRVNSALKKSIINAVRQKKDVAWSVVGQDKDKAGKRGNNKRKRFRGGGISGAGGTPPLVWLERGTRAHLVPHLLSYRDSGGQVTYRNQRHPGAKATAAVRAVYSAEATASRDAMMKKLATELEAEINKLGGVT